LVERGAESRIFAVMRLIQTRTDNERAELQVLMKHNRREIREMEAAGDVEDIECADED
ncbi:hypothetical protein F442_22323, partial [Phytophthora nicotianae P10297]